MGYCAALFAATTLGSVAGKGSTERQAVLGMDQCFRQAEGPDPS